MRLLKAESHRRMPWKNGGGETIEIAVHPPGAGLSDFDWRISMAKVASDGPFSVFPGVDRTLCVLDGDGFDLDVAGGGRRRLTVASEPLLFPADAPTTAQLLGGPVTDLNVMTRRDGFTHAVRRLRDLAGHPFPACGRWTFIVATARSSLVVDGCPVVLAAFDALRLDKGATVDWDASARPDGALIIEIDAVPKRLHGDQQA